MTRELYPQYQVVAGPHFWELEVTSSADHIVRYVILDPEPCRLIKTAVRLAEQEEKILAHARALYDRRKQNA